MRVAGLKVLTWGLLGHILRLSLSLVSVCRLRRIVNGSLQFLVEVGAFIEYLFMVLEKTGAVTWTAPGYCNGL